MNQLDSVNTLYTSELESLLYLRDKYGIRNTDFSILLIALRRMVYDDCGAIDYLIHCAQFERLKYVVIEKYKPKCLMLRFVL